MTGIARGSVADERRASIADRSHDGEEWTVRYDRTSGTLPGEFAI
ncbi:hypothetical protein [Nocardioides sp. BYT-33-1]